MKDVKLLKGKDVRRIHKDAAHHERIGTPHWQRPKRTNHNIHGLCRERQGQIAADLKPRQGRRGRRCAERVIFEDPKRNYKLTVHEYIDNHRYGRPGTGPHPPRPNNNVVVRVVTKPFNFLADHPIIHIPMFLVGFGAHHGESGDVTWFDYLVIGATPGALASAAEAVKLGKKVALVVQAEAFELGSSVSYSKHKVPAGLAKS